MKIEYFRQNFMIKWLNETKVQIVQVLLKYFVELLLLTVIHLYHLEVQRSVVRFLTTYYLFIENFTPNHLLDRFEEGFSNNFHSNFELLSLKIESWHISQRILVQLEYQKEWECTICVIYNSTCGTRINELSKMKQAQDLKNRK